MAHEIGHGLGMDHDFRVVNGRRVGYRLCYRNTGRCVPCMGVGGIMDYYNTKTRWSPCSNYFIHKYVS